jgi:hypothetical protein
MLNRAMAQEAGDARPAPDLVDRNFTAEAQNPLWARRPKVPTAQPLE